MAVANVTCPRAADIILMIDHSTSIAVGDPQHNNWFQILAFAKRIAGAFPIGTNLTRFGLLTFGSGVAIAFHLNRYGDRNSLLRAIDDVHINGGQTNIAAALRTAREIMFAERHGARPGVPKILILLTDGTDNREAYQTLLEADQTKAANITIFTVGVTHRVYDYRLREIASTPEHFFFASNFTELNSVLQKLVEDSCSEAATPPAVNTTPAATTTTTTPTTPTTTTTTTTERTNRGMLHRVLFESE